MTDKGEADVAMPTLAPHGNIVIPDIFARSNANDGSGVAPAAESAQPGASEATTAVETASEVVAVAPSKRESSSLTFQPISPGLSSVSLPLGPGPKIATEKEAKSVRRLSGCSRVCMFTSASSVEL